jgi:hypothetical protein
VAAVPSHPVVIAGLDIVFFVSVDRFFPVQWRPCCFRVVSYVFLHAVHDLPNRLTVETNRLS